MGKKQFLDPCRTAIGIVLSALALAACSMPEVVILNDPLTPEEHINLGVSYEQGGELELALKHYRAASEDMPLAFLYVGNVHFLRKEYAEAESSYEKAIRKTGDPRALNNLAWLYYTLDRELERAEALASEAVELNPENTSFRDTLDTIREKRSHGSLSAP